MHKFVLLVMIFIVIMGLAFTGCQKASQPTMTAAQVVQHVDQVLEREYENTTLIHRYETRYDVLSAKQRQIKNNSPSQPVWEVKVKVTREYQVLREGVWVRFPQTPNPTSYDRTYLFYEDDARLVPLF